MRRELPTIRCEDKPCGVCCFGQAALPASWYVGLYPNLLGSLPVELQKELLLARDRIVAGEFNDEMPCIWLDMQTRRCKHYEHRPELCKNAVKAGDDHCRRDRKKFGIDPNTRRAWKNGRMVLLG